MRLKQPLNESFAWNDNDAWWLIFVVVALIGGAVAGYVEVVIWVGRELGLI